MGLLQCAAAAAGVDHKPPAKVGGPMTDTLVFSPNSPYRDLVTHAMRNHQTRNRDLWQVWLADQSRWVDLADQEALTCHFRVMHRDDDDAPFQTGGRFVKRHVPRKLDSECPPIPCPN